MVESLPYCLLHQTAVLSSSECSLPLVDSQKLLVDLATKIVDSASAIEVQIF